MRAQSDRSDPLVTLLCKRDIVKGVEMGHFGHSKPWKISPQTRAQQEKRAPGGCGGVAQLPQTPRQASLSNWRVMVCYCGHHKITKVVGENPPRISPDKTMKSVDHSSNPHTGFCSIRQTT
jgi:hypothetical protein